MDTFKYECYIPERVCDISSHWKYVKYVTPVFTSYKQTGTLLLCETEGHGERRVQTL